MDQFGAIQETMQKFLSLFLLGSGIIISLMGLFLWLGGLRSIRLIAAMSLAGLGFWFAWTSHRDAFYVLVLVPIFAGVMGMIFKKAAGAMLGVVTAGLLGGLLVTAPLVMNAEFWQNPNRNAGNSQANGDPMSILNEAKEYMEVMAGRFDELVNNLPVKAKTTGSTFLVMAGLLAFFKPLWVAALYTSSIGTAQIATGIVLLLLFKGAQPLAYIESHSQALTAAAGGMVLLGAVIQASLCKEKKKKKSVDMEKILQGDQG